MVLMSTGSIIFTNPITEYFGTQFTNLQAQNRDGKTIFSLLLEQYKDNIEAWFVQLIQQLYSTNDAFCLEKDFYLGFRWDSYRTVLSFQELSYFGKYIGIKNKTISQFLLKCNPKYRDDLLLDSIVTEDIESYRMLRQEAKAVLSETILYKSLNNTAKINDEVLEDFLSDNSSEPRLNLLVKAILQTDDNFNYRIDEMSRSLLLKDIIKHS